MLAVSGRKNAIMVATALLAFVAPMSWLLDLSPFSSGITVYPVYCGEDLGSHGPCVGLPAITYQASPYRHEVSYWTDTGIPTALTDCAVRDSRNWECWYKDRAGRLSMADGEFHEEIREPVLNRDVFDSVRYVPKWKWWAVRIGVVAE